MALGLPRVTRCCFCFSLKTGSLIIGYLSLFSAITLMAMSVMGIYMVAKFVTKSKVDPPEGHNPNDVYTESIRLYTIFGFQFVIYTLYFTISLLLVVGVHKNKPKYMRYYFIMGLIVLVLNLVALSVTFIFTGFMTTASQLISCAITFYYLLVVRSTYLEIEEMAKPPPYELQYLNRQQAPLMV